MSDDGPAAYAAERGLATESPADFHARYIGLAMPGAATAAAPGRAARRRGREGSLAWLEFSSEVDMEVEYAGDGDAERPRELPITWLDPDDVGSRPRPTAFPRRCGGGDGGRAGASRRRGGRSPSTCGRRGRRLGAEIDRFATGAQALATDLDSITEKSTRGRHRNHRKSRVFCRS